MTVTTDTTPVATPPIAPEFPAPGETTSGPPGTNRWRERILAVMFGLLGVAAFVGFWAFISWRNSDLPGPLDAWDELWSLLAEGFSSSTPYGKGIMLQLGDSLGLTLKGFGFAALVGIPVGLACGGNRRIFQAVNPLVQLLKPVSPLAWFPIGLVAYKDGPQAEVFVIFVTALWPIILNTAVGASSVPADHRNVARVFRFRRGPYLRQVVVPHTMPSIITGLRLSMGIAWMVIVAVEMLSGATGIGSFVWNSYNGGNIPAMMAAIILIGVVGVVLDNIFVFAGKRYAVGGTE